MSQPLFSSFSPGLPSARTIRRRLSSPATVYSCLLEQIGHFHRLLYAGAVLPAAARQFVILRSKSALQLSLGWEFHFRRALEAGLDPALIEQAKNQERIVEQPYGLLSDAVQNILAMEPLPEAIQEGLISYFTAQGMSEIILLTGLERLLAQAIHATDEPLSEEAPPW